MMVIWSCYIPNKFHMSRWVFCMCYRSNLVLGYSIFKLAYFFQTRLIYVLILMSSDNKIVFECLFVLGPFLPVFFSICIPLLFVRRLIFLLCTTDTTIQN